MISPAWNIDPTCILSRPELAAVLSDLTDRSVRLAGARVNLILVRLSCCCGLRAAEIGALRLDDVRVGTGRPHLVIRAAAAKGGRPRRVPLWWDAGTLADLTAWKGVREDQGASTNDPLVCAIHRLHAGRPLNRHVIRRRFRTACK